MSQRVSFDRKKISSERAHGTDLNYAASFVRQSHQRDAIMSLLRQQTHPTAVELILHVKKYFPHTSRATIYRNLEQLKEKGLISEVFVDGETRYELAEASHHHFICLSCNKIEDIDIDTQKVPLAEVNKVSSSVKDISITIRGTCATCGQSAD